jgi:putative nucleotidyltransferase with HDIG domain
MHRLGTAESEDQVGSRSITPEMRGWLDRAVQDRASACTDMPRDVQGWLGGSSGRALCIPLRRDSSLTGVVFVIDWAVEDVEHRLPELDRLVTRVDVALHNARLVDRVTRMSEETVEALARAIDATSTWTAGHSKRVTRMAMTLGRELRLNADALDRLYRGGMLHDVGKLGVSGHVLDKPGKLTAEEFEQVRRHPVLGATILGPLSVFRDIIPLIEQHHEKFDGTGYPEGLTGPEIALEARVLAVADVFDALISSRPYRAAMPLETVVEIIERDSGSHFDPYVVDAFMDLYRRDALPLSEVAAAAAAPEREADPVAPGSR